MELCSMLCGNLDGRGLWGRMDTYICMAECLHYSPETITTLLIDYILIKFFKRLSELEDISSEISQSATQRNMK